MGYVSRRSPLERLGAALPSLPTNRSEGGPTVPLSALWRHSCSGGNELEVSDSVETVIRVAQAAIAGQRIDTQIGNEQVFATSWFLVTPTDSGGQLFANPLTVAYVKPWNRLVQQPSAPPTANADR